MCIHGYRLDSPETGLDQFARRISAISDGEGEGRDLFNQPAVVFRNESTRKSGCGVIMDPCQQKDDVERKNSYHLGFGANESQVIRENA